MSAMSMGLCRDYFRNEKMKRSEYSQDIFSEYPSPESCRIMCVRFSFALNPPGQTAITHPAKVSVT
jgi:hypothetical protein